MVLVDTSVWIFHLRYGNDKLKRLLNVGYVICHPFIIAELSCGNLKNRNETLSLFQSLPMVIEAEHEEVMWFIENYQLMGKGLGYIDIHLISSSLLSRVSIWTIDKKLYEISLKLGMDFE